LIVGGKPTMRREEPHRNRMVIRFGDEAPTLAACGIANSGGPSVRFTLNGGPLEHCMVEAVYARGSMTVDEFLALSLPDGKAELVRGDLRLTPPPAAFHGLVASNIVLALGMHVRRHALGRVFGDNVGDELTMIPRTVRVPDASFIRAARLPAEGFGRGLFRSHPDLAVEVLSPSESASDLEEKLDDYLSAGTPLIWVIDPMRRTVMVVAPDVPVRWLRDEQLLEGGDVVPGFLCPLAEVFDGIAPQL
jgi:Uma2 family endonuclease